MTLFVSVMAGGILSGVLFAMVAAGFSLVWATIRSVNFAHGDLFALGGYVTLGTAGLFASVGQNVGVGTLIAAAVASCVCGALIAAVISALLQRFVFRPLSHAWHLAAPLSTLGLSIAIESGLAIWVGSDYKPSPVTFPTDGVGVAGTQISYAAIAIVIFGISLVCLVRWLLQKTRLGLSMRATSWDSPTVELMGVNTQRLALVAFIVAGLLVGAAGSLNTMYFGQITFYSGFSLTIFGFTAAVVGGYGSVSGALIGGLVVGVAQALIGGVVSSAWQQAITFILLAAVLLMRPTGIIGERLAVRT
jgi:branched-chain amino acid transport system permease protein